MTSPAQEKMIRQIKALFAIADDKNGNEFQQNAALAKAYELLTRAKMDKHEVLGHVKPEESYNKDSGLEYDGRIPTEFYYINGILIEFFNIDTVKDYRKKERTDTITKNGWRRAKRSDGVVWFIGKQEDIEIAKVIYNQLYYQYKQLWDQYRKRTGAETANKRNYYQGLMVGMFQRLKDQKKTIENELALVIVKDPEIKKATEKFFPKTTNIATSKVRYDDRIRNAGLNDSEKIRLDKAITNGDNNRTLLLN